MLSFLPEADILRAVNSFNGWWQGTRPQPHPFKRLAYFATKRHLKDARLKRAILLNGPRRVGKTTILLQLANDLIDGGAEPASVLYLSLDHPLLKLLTLPKILELYHQHIHPAGKPATLLLDEIQYSSEWDLELKQLVDRHPEYRIVATGSASTEVRERIVESGVGRWMTVPVPTLSFYEYVHIAGLEAPKASEGLKPSSLFGRPQKDLQALAHACATMQPQFVRYLLVGGFPETALINDVAFCQRLLREDVVERVLKRDMVSLFGIRNIDELERLFIYLCLNTGGIISIAKCASELQMNRVTVNEHLDKLQGANLVYRLERFGNAVLRQQYKFYLIDAALRNAVLLRGPEIVSEPAEMGLIVETTVHRHLRAFHYRDNPRIGYWQDTKTGREVDIIVKSPAYTLPVEVKYRANSKIGPKDGIVAFCKEEKIPSAFWITKSDEDFSAEKMAGCPTQFLRIPAHVFCYLIGQAERHVWE